MAPESFETEMLDLAGEFHDVSLRCTGWLLFEDARFHPFPAAVNQFSKEPIESLDIGSAVEALCADPAMAALNFSDETGPTISVSMGGRGFRDTNPPNAIVSKILQSAAKQLFYLNRLSEREVYLDLVRDGCQQLRDACNGRPIQRLQAIGFGGLAFPPNTRFETPWGPVSSAVLFLPGGRPQAHQREPATHAVLLTKRPFVVALGEDEPVPTPDSDATSPTVHDPEVLIPLAAALSTRDPNKTPVVLWSYKFFPFTEWVRVHYPYFVPTLRTVSPMAPDEVDAMTAKLAVLTPLTLDSVAVAIRRVVGALSIRIHPADVLVDSVTAWENLLGTGDEVSFRVTAALARLLSTPSTNVLSEQKRLKRIYGLRSRLVHGGVESAQVNANAKDALSIALQALDATISRGQDWLALKSEQRADRLLLGDVVASTGPD